MVLYERFDELRFVLWVVLVIKSKKFKIGVNVRWKWVVDEEELVEVDDMVVVELDVIKIEVV